MSPTLRSLSRREFLWGSAAVAGSTLLAACGNGPSPGTGSTSSKQSGPVKLQVTVWLGADELKAMTTLADQFTRAHPNVQVEYINIVNGGPYGETKLQQMIGGGTPPDVMMLNSGQFESFAARRALGSLDDLASRDKLDMGIYYPQSITGCKLNGHLYGLPKDISNVIVYLNKGLFQKAGVPLPPADWNWNQYRATAKQLTSGLNSGGKTTAWGTVLINADWNWTPFVWTNGGQVYVNKQCKLTNRPAVDALSYFFGLEVNDKAAPTSEAIASFGSQGAEISAFLGGAIGFGIFGPWLRPGLVQTKTLDWTIRPVPRGPQGQRPTIPLYVDMWGMSASTKYREEAWTLMKWLTGETGQKAWLDLYGARSISPIKKLTQSSEWIGYGGEEHRADGQTIIGQLDPAHNRRPAVAFANGTEAETLWDNEFKLVLAGQESVETATQNIKSRLDGILQRQT